MLTMYKDILLNSAVGAGHARECLPAYSCGPHIGGPYALPTKNDPLP